MGGAAVEGDLLPGDRLDAGDDADLPVLLGQHGPLLDMAFEVGVRRVEADRALTLEPDALELVEGPEDGEPAEDAEAPVEGTGGGHGVDVRADEDRGEFGILPFSASEDRAHLIDGDLEVELIHPRKQQFATGPVLICQRLAVDTDEAGRLIVIGAD